MFTSVIGWIKGLSIAGRIILGGVGVTALGAVATVSPSPQPVDTGSEVKAEQTVKLPVITTEMVTETESIPFAKEVVETDSLNKGETEITRAGINGVRTITYKVTKSDGNQTAKTQISNEETTRPVNEVTSIGTYVAPPPAQRNNCDPNYSPCVPVVSYDLDCPDIGFSVSVLGSDPHRFDRDGDGYGCESY